MFLVRIKYKTVLFADLSVQSNLNGFWDWGYLDKPLGLQTLSPPRCVLLLSERSGSGSNLNCSSAVSSAVSRDNYLFLMRLALDSMKYIQHNISTKGSDYIFSYYYTQ